MLVYQRVIVASGEEWWMELLPSQIHGETLHQIFPASHGLSDFFIATDKTTWFKSWLQSLEEKKPDLRFAFHDISTDMYLNHPKSIFDLGVYLHTSYIHL